MLHFSELQVFLDHLNDSAGVWYAFRSFEARQEPLEAEPCPFQGAPGRGGQFG